MAALEAPVEVGTSLVVQYLDEAVVCVALSMLCTELDLPASLRGVDLRAGKKCIAGSLDVLALLNRRCRSAQLTLDESDIAEQRTEQVDVW